MQRRIILCGGSGFVGRRLSRMLIDLGYSVTVVSRNPTPTEVEWSQLAEVLNDAEAVINLAGRSIACRFTEANKRAILDSRVDSTRRIAEAIAGCAHPPQLWINASASGYYGECGEDTVRVEHSAGSGFVSEVCQAWEAACLKPDLEIRRVILRIGIVLADGGGVLGTLLPLARWFLGGSAGSGRQWMPWISLGDLCRLICSLIDHDSPSVINACSPNPVRNCDLMAWVRREVRRPWSPPAPKWIVEWIGRVLGPDGSLALTSCRALPNEGFGFEFTHRNLADVHLSDLAN